jgi:PhnB protein
MKNSNIHQSTLPTALLPWLNVRDGEKAVSFYKSAFGAKEVYRLDEPGAGVVVRLEVGAVQFWLSDGVDEQSEVLGGGSLRMILTVKDPLPLFDQAIAAGATEIFPVGEEHGWRLGRLMDPFGLHWEIGCELE